MRVEVPVGAQEYYPIQSFEFWRGGSGGRRLPIEATTDPRDPTEIRRVNYSGYKGVIRFKKVKVDEGLVHAERPSTLDYLIKEERDGKVIIDEVLQYVDGSQSEPISHKDHGEFVLVETRGPGGNILANLKSLI